MLSCCNSHFSGTFFYVVSHKPYRTLEYGICPVCGVEKFRDYKQYANGIEKIKEFKGLAATDEFIKWRGLIRSIEKEIFFGGDVCYGQGVKTQKKDNCSNPIYKQLRKNFYNQSETIGEVKTIVLVR